jgi:AcrR family transcriptional regulator
MDKKEIQRRRMMSYFIDAAKQIIDDEGPELVSARKVADIAGYNSATIYNYFDNLDHLIFFASMKYLKEYVMDLRKYTKGISNPVEKYLKIWECFCMHSFNNPKIYQLIFFNKFSTSLNDAVTQYYKIFPEELDEQEEGLMPMLLEKNIYARDYAALQACAKQGFIKKDHIYEINEINLLMYQGMLQNILTQQLTYSLEEAVARMLKYIKQVMKSYYLPKE